MKPRLSGVGGTEVENNSGKLLEMSVKVGDDVTLPCEVESVPPPIITWAKDKQLISPFSNRYELHLCESLFIMNAYDDNKCEHRMTMFR